MRLRNSIGGTVLLVGAAAMLLTAVLHGTVNVPHLREDMLATGLRPGLLGAISLVLYFSVVAMAIFGMLVLSAAIAALRGRPSSPVPLWFIAAGYLIFGLIAFVRVDANPHFLGYATMGLIVAAGAALSAMMPGERTREAA